MYPKVSTGKSLLPLEKSKIELLLKQYENFDENIMHRFLLENSYQVIANFRKTRESCVVILNYVLSKKIESKNYDAKNSIKLILAQLYLLEVPSILLIDKMVSSTIQQKLSSTLIYLLRNKYLSIDEIQTIYQILPGVIDRIGWVFKIKTGLQSTRSFKNASIFKSCNTKWRVSKKEAK